MDTLDLDLDIHNYSFQDILDLYKVDKLDDKTIKLCYKTTMLTHPDKSKLDKSIFLFFVKAFKLLHSVYETHKQQNSGCVSREEYEKLYHSSIDELDKQNEPFIDTLKEKMTSNNFNKWFNKTFESLGNIDDEFGGGYDDWYRSNSEETSKAKNMNDMHNLIQQKKTQLRQITVYEEPKTIEDSAYNLVRDKPTYYGSGVFSKLAFEDLKKAHTETVIPVTERDMRKSYQSMDDYRSHRDGDLHKYKHISAEQRQQDINKQQQLDIEHTYRLTQQMEKTKQFQKQWWSSLRQIGNG